MAQLSSQIYPICVVLFLIDPLLHTAYPQVISSNHSMYICPVFQIIHWDIPQSLPSDLAESLYDLQAPFDTDLVTFLGHLEGSIETYFKLIAPYDTPNFPLLLQYPPCLLPTLQSNPNFVPLGSNQKYVLKYMYDTHSTSPTLFILVYIYLFT